MIKLKISYQGTSGRAVSTTLCIGSTLGVTLLLMICQSCR
jgi:hypothetical protein